MLRLGSHEVREAQPDILRQLLGVLTEKWQKIDPQRLLLVYGSGEPREIGKSIEEWASARGAKCVCVKERQLPDIEGPPGLVSYLPQWLNHTNLSSIAVSNDLIAEALRRI